MKISGLSCITKKIFLVFLGHPNLQSSVCKPQSQGCCSAGKWFLVAGARRWPWTECRTHPFFNSHSAVPLIVEQGWVSEQRQAREWRRFHEAKLPFPRIPPSRWARLPDNINFSGRMVDEAPWQRWGCLSFASQRWKSCSCPAEPLFPRTRRGPWEQRISASEGKQISAREKTKRKWTECLISSNLVIKPEQSILCQLKKTPLLWINGQAGWPTMLQRLKRLK